MWCRCAQCCKPLAANILAAENQLGRIIESIEFYGEENLPDVLREAIDSLTLPKTESENEHGERPESQKQ
jgi:hypothetical protein